MNKEIIIAIEQLLSSLIDWVDIADDEDKRDHDYQAIDDGKATLVKLRATLLDPDDYLKVCTKTKTELYEIGFHRGFLFRQKYDQTEKGDHCLTGIIETYASILSTREKMPGMSLEDFISVDSISTLKNEYNWLLAMAEKDGE